MWIVSECEGSRPPELEQCRDIVIVRRNFRYVAATEEKAAHWEYEEWQMTKEQFEVYQAMVSENNDISDALIELAEMIVGGE